LVDIIDLAIAIVIKTVAGIKRGRELLPYAFTPFAIFTELLARFTRPFSNRIRRAAITLKFLAVRAGQAFINRAIAVVIATVGHFGLGKDIAVTLAPRSLIAALKTIATKALLAVARCTRKTILQLVFGTNTGINIVFVDEAVAIIVDAVATGIRVVGLVDRWTFKNGQPIRVAGRHKLLAGAKTAIKRRKCLAIRANVGRMLRINAKNVRTARRNEPEAEHHENPIT